MLSEPSRLAFLQLSRLLKELSKCSKLKFLCIPFAACKLNFNPKSPKTAAKNNLDARARSKSCPLLHLLKISKSEDHSTVYTGPTGAMAIKHSLNLAWIIILLHLHQSLQRPTQLLRVAGLVQLCSVEKDRFYHLQRRRSSGTCRWQALA